MPGPRKARGSSALPPSTKMEASRRESWRPAARIRNPLVRKLASDKWLVEVEDEWKRVAVVGEVQDLAESARATGDTRAAAILDAVAHLLRLAQIEFGEILELLRRHEGSPADRSRLIAKQLGFDLDRRKDGALEPSELIGQYRAYLRCGYEPIAAVQELADDADPPRSWRRVRDALFEAKAELKAGNPDLATLPIPEAHSEPPRAKKG